MPFTVIILLDIAIKYRYIAIMIDPLMETALATEERTGPPSQAYRVHARAVPRTEVIHPHYHADFEIVLFGDIQGHTIVNGRAHSVLPGSVHCIAPHAVHSFRIGGAGTDATVVVAQIQLEQALTVADSNGALVAEVLSRLPHLPVVLDPPLDDAVRCMRSMGTVSRGLPRGASERLAQTGAVYGLLSVLVARAPSGAQATLPDPRVRRIMDTVAEHAFERTSLSRIAHICGLSRFYLCRLFKRQTGMTVSEYLTSIRVARARHLLAGGRRTVTSVCLECGFESLSYFIAVFARHTGLTPKQWALRSRDRKG